MDKIVDKLITANLMDYRRYAEIMYISLYKRGGSQSMIRKKQLEKSVALDVNDGSLAFLEEYSTEPELIVTVIIARSQRLGPYRAGGKRIEFWQII